MSIGLAARVLPAALLQEATVMDQPMDSSENFDWGELPSIEYLWSDLTARRVALSLRHDDLAALLGMNAQRYRTYESGGRSKEAPLGLVSELKAMEAFVAGETRALIEQAATEGIVVLRAVADEQEFADRYPTARTGRTQAQYPVTLHHVAVGRAAAEFSRRDRDVEVYRGERRFDMAAARLACGLGKNETAHLLGVNEKTYYAAERGTRPPREKSITELQEIDDFIDMMSGELEVTVNNAGSTIWVLDDQADFQNTYPQAFVERSGKPYPVNVLWAAAGRRAGEIEAAGQPARIAVRT